MSVQAFLSHFADRLRALFEESGVPGGSAALLLDGEVVEAATGVLNRETGAEATTDSLWQIGSVSKLYTATLVAKLADAGRIELDAPAGRYLPGGLLPSADTEAAAAITVAHLLEHSSGLESDHYHDVGAGRHAVGAYLDSIAGFGTLFPAGRAYSYSNIGYAVLAAIVEHATGSPFDEALLAQVIAPIGAEHTETSLEGAVRRRVAIGHVDIMPGFVVPPRWRWIPLLTAVGGVIASPGDMLRLARLHIEDGAVGGLQLLSRDAAAAMREARMPVPARSLAGATARGLGWGVHGGAGPIIVSHDGDTVGQQALLVAVPERGFAFAAAGNSNRAGAAIRALAEETLRDVLGVELARPADGRIPRLDPRRGRYRRLHLDWVVEARDGAHAISAEPDALFSPIFQGRDVPIRPDGGGEWRFASAVGGVERAAFLDLEDAGRPTHLHAGGRAHRLVEGATA